MFVEFIYNIHVLKNKHIQSCAMQKDNDYNKILVKFLKSLSFFQFLGTVFSSSLKNENHAFIADLSIINSFLK